MPSMPSTPFRRSARVARVARAVVLLSTLVAAAACGDDDGPTGSDEPEIESVRLTITPSGGAATSYTVTANGAAPSPVQLRVGASTITAVPLDAAGQPVDEAPEFELRLSGLPAGVTFTTNGTLTAPISATTATAATVQVAAIMWHRTEGHDDYTANFALRVAQ